MGSYMDNIFSSILNPILKFLDIIISFVFSSKIITIIVGLLLLNALGFYMMYYDKKLAQYNGKVKEEHPELDEDELKKQHLLKRRTPERTLLLVAAVFGSLGVLGGMYKFRHKTQKPLFKYGVPAIIVLQIIFVIYNIVLQFQAK